MRAKVVRVDFNDVFHQVVQLRSKLLVETKLARPCHITVPPQHIHHRPSVTSSAIPPFTSQDHTDFTFAKPPSF
eukprot:1508819-Amphidinium_carterae.1